MSPELKSYSLHLLFDKNQITLEELTEKANNTLLKYSQENSLNIDISQPTSVEC